MIFDFDVVYFDFAFFAGSDIDDIAVLIEASAFVVFFGCFEDEVIVGEVLEVVVRDDEDCFHVFAEAKHGIL